MTTIIATKNFNVIEPSTKNDQRLNQELLLKIIRELKKLNIQMSLMTDEEIQNMEIS